MTMRPGRSDAVGRTDRDRSATDPARRLTPVVRLAPAKLNLSLAVVGRRPDGYHELHSVMVRLDLADRLSRRPGRRRRPTRSTSTGSIPARARTTSSCGRWPARARPSGPAGPDPAGRHPPLAARLDKRIPVAAGLAGGSERRRGGARRRARGVGRGADHPRAAPGSPRRLGSDVPFFLADGAALVEGRGETVTPLPGSSASRRRPARDPAPGAPTPDVFAAYDAGARQRPVPPGRSSAAPRRRAPGRADGPGARRAGRRARRAPTTSCPPRATVEPGLVASPARAVPTARPTGRSVRLRPDPVGPLSFAGRGRRRGRRGSAALAVADRPIVGAGEPFVDGHDHRRTGRPTTGAIDDPRSHHDRPAPRRPSARTARPSRPTTSSSARARSGSIRRPASSSSGIEAQAERALRNLGAVLEAAGLGWADVVKTTIFLADIGDFATVNAVYADSSADPPPARSTFAVAALPRGALIEIEVIAARRLSGRPGAAPRV